MARILYYIAQDYIEVEVKHTWLILLADKPVIYDTANPPTS